MNNYSQWNVLHYLWDNISDFKARWSLLPGIHTIIFANQSLSIDVMVNEYVQLPTSGIVPVFFSGAISNRKSKTGPFFTGRSITGSDKLPLISIADPTLDVDPELEIAWYAGLPGQHLTEAIAEILSAIHESTSKELLLVGGSGGGFAALQLGRILGDKVSLLVWNAQTDIYEYSERFVKKYLRCSFGFAHATLNSSTWKEYCAPRTSKHVDMHVLYDDTLTRPRRILYLQNETDWHREKHLIPLWNLSSDVPIKSGVNSLDNDHQVLVHDLANGHEPPSPNLVKAILVQMLDPGSRIVDIVVP